MHKFFKKFLYIFLFISLFSIYGIRGIGVPNLAHAFSPDGEIITYDVTPESFCVVWEAQINNGSNYSFEIIVYQGGNPVSGLSQSQVGMSQINGTTIMAARVVGLAQNTDYSYQIKVLEDGVPQSLFPSTPKTLKTAINDFATAPNNPTIYFKVYQMDGVTPAEGAFVLIQIGGAAYPVTGEGYGWVSDAGETSVCLGGGTIYKGNGQFTLTGASTETVTAICLGGSYGSKTINGGVIDLVNYCQPGFECEADWLNKVVLVPNQAPDISIESDHSMRWDDTNKQYVIKVPAENFTLDLKATDAEGEAISDWTLENEPDGMSITPDADPTKAQVTWAPASANPEPYTVKVTVKDVNSNIGDLTFKVLATDGKPTAPTLANVTPLSPKTDDHLVCSSSGASDPLGETITYYYKWHKTPVGSTIWQETTITSATVSNDVTTKGEKWKCAVTVKDDPFDSESDIKWSNEVEIGNSYPSGTISVTITSTSPDTNSTQLTATVTRNNVTDADAGDTIATRIEWYNQSASGTKYSQSTSTDTTVNTTLQGTDLKKGQTWVCKAVVTENGNDTSSPLISDQKTVKIGNIVPTAPTSAAITPGTNGLECSVSGAGDPDVTDGVDTMKYKYEWICSNTSKNEIHDNKTSSTDTLDKSKLVKGDTWYCKVWAHDGTVYSTSFAQTDPPYTVPNTPPSKPAGSISAAPGPYKNATLTCTVTTPSVDNDQGDSVTTTYEWYKNGALESTGASNTLSGAVQGAQYYCKVIACDTSSACATSDPTNTITIENRKPTITITDNDTGAAIGDSVKVNEEATLNLLITGQDQDSNALTYSAQNLPGWASFNAGTRVLSCTPGPQTAGPYAVTFKVEDDGAPAAKSETKIVTINVVYPSVTIDDFEYVTGDLATNGWFRVYGVGKYELGTESSTSHYLWTKVTMSNYDANSITATKQTDYVVTKWLSNPLSTQTYRELQFFIADRNLYNIEAYVHAVDDKDQGKNYFLRYIPQNPTDPAKPYVVNGVTINYYIGSEFIDPNGCQVTRDMDKDLNKALASQTGSPQVHYDYILCLVVRGDVDRLDDIVAAYGVRDYDKPEDVVNLNAVPKNQAVVLGWSDPEVQDDDVVGYRIEWAANGQTINHQDVAKTVKNLTIPNLTNGTLYSFTVKVLDDEEPANCSNGVTTDATPNQDNQAPDMSNADLTATSPLDKGKVVVLTWNAPTDADLAYFKIYKNGEFVAQVNKSSLTTYSYTVTGLVDDTPYTFKVVAYDDVLPTPNSSFREVQGTPNAPEEIVFDDFQYTGTGKPTDNGWFELQGKGNGSINRVDVSGNSFMSLTTTYSNKLNYIVTKFPTNPEEYCTNSELHFDARGVAANFRFEIYVKATNGNKYIISCQPDASTKDDVLPANPVSGLYITYKLGWQEYNSGNTWRYDIAVNLNKILEDAIGSGVAFDYCVGIIVRGAVDLDNIKFVSAIPDVTNLVAKAGDQEVELNWTSSDESVTVFLLSILNSANQEILASQVISPTLINGTTEYSFTVGSSLVNLTNGQEYTFKVMQKVNGVDSNGVKVKSTPKAFVFFDECGTLDYWSEDAGTLGDLTVVYDQQVHSEVVKILPGAGSIYANAPAGSEPIRYFVERVINQNTTDHKVSLRAKANDDFMLWFKVRDTFGVEYDLLYVTGGVLDQGSAYGTWAYSYLGSSSTSGQWVTVTLDLNLLMSKYYGVPLAGVNSLLIGSYGEVRVDDLGIY